MTSYQRTLLELLKIVGIKPVTGETIIFVWKDANHYECTGECTDDIGILRVPSEILKDIVTKNDKKNIAVCCIGFSAKPDYSDLSVIYFMELGV